MGFILFVLCAAAKYGIGKGHERGDYFKRRDLVKAKQFSQK